jgi:hypothetical protein
VAWGRLLSEPDSRFGVGTISMACKEGTEEEEEEEDVAALDMGLVGPGDNPLFFFKELATNGVKCPSMKPVVQMLLSLLDRSHLSSKHFC